MGGSDDSTSTGLAYRGLELVSSSGRKRRAIERRGVGVRDHGSRGQCANLDRTRTADVV